MPTFSYSVPRSIALHGVKSIYALTHNPQRCSKSNVGEPQCVVFYFSVSVFVSIIHTSSVFDGLKAVRPALPPEKVNFHLV